MSDTVRPLLILCEFVEGCRYLAEERDDDAVVPFAKKPRHVFCNRLRSEDTAEPDGQKSNSETIGLFRLRRNYTCTTPDPGSQ